MAAVRTGFRKIQKGPYTIEIYAEKMYQGARGAYVAVDVNGVRLTQLVGGKGRDSADQAVAKWAERYAAMSIEALADEVAEWREALAERVAKLREEINATCKDISALEVQS